MSEQGEPVAGSEVARWMLHGGLDAVRDRMMLQMRDLVGLGFDPALVVVGMLTGAGEAAGVLVAERQGEAPDDDLCLDLAVVARGAIELTAALARALARDPGGQVDRDPAVLSVARDVVDVQDVLVSDLRRVFGARLRTLHPLSSVATVGSA